MEASKNKRIFSWLMVAITVSPFLKSSSERFLPVLTYYSGSVYDTLMDKSPALEEKRYYDPEVFKKLYDKRGKLLSSKWKSSDKIAAFIMAIHNVSQDGLHPEDYHISEIEKLSEEIIFSDKAEDENVGRLESLLNDALMLLLSHLSHGKTDPETIDPQWDVLRKEVKKDWRSFIDSALERSDIIETIHSLTPEDSGYRNLKKALAKYREIEEKGGWQIFNTDLAKLDTGMRHPDVSLLRNRLDVIQGAIEFDPEDENLFDQNLHNQVVLFQQRNGIDPDGVVGKSTIEALNITVRKRIEIMEANLERLRWIKGDLGVRYVRVNIPGFELQVIENSKQVFKSPAIVGSFNGQTPVFSSTIKYLVLNPDWVIPPGILENEIIPAVKKNRAYLDKNHMKILQNDGREIDTATIAWSSVSSKGFPYQIRQEPGPGNPLGRIKFVFPNTYHVFIHDTPSRSLFRRSNRTFSHGCIRIDKAYELAEYLLKDSPGWDRTRINKALQQGSTQAIILPDPVPVHILYLTAWADDDGNASFGKDIYNRDQQLITALNQRAPALNR